MLCYQNAYWQHVIYQNVMDLASTCYHNIVNRTHTHTRMHARTHARARTHTNTHACIHACAMYAVMHAHMYEHMHAYTALGAHVQPRTQHTVSHTHKGLSINSPTTRPKKFANFERNCTG